MEKRQVAVETRESGVGQVKEGKSKGMWQKPKFEDVSGKVMAQPYIRFT